MVPLATRFRKEGWDFVQIVREGDRAIFRKTKSGFAFETFEVVLIRKDPEHRWPNGIVTPEHERMPGDRQWGLYGFSCQTRERAWEKFRELAA